VRCRLYILAYTTYPLHLLVSSLVCLTEPHAYHGRGLSSPRLVQHAIPFLQKTGDEPDAFRSIRTKKDVLPPSNPVHDYEQSQQADCIHDLI